MHSDIGRWLTSLKEAGFTPYKQAASEICVIGLISILPLAFASVGVFVDQGAEEGTRKSFLDIFLAASLSGQLFFYAISLMASVIWYSGTEFRNPFPIRLYFIIPCVIGIGVATIYISRDPTLKSLADADIGTVSLLIYLGSAVLYFIILVFRSVDPPDIEQSRRDGELDLLNRVKQKLSEEAK